MPFEDLNRGDKLDIHVHLYEKEVEIVDALAAKYNCSRAAVLGELIMQAGKDKRLDLSQVIPEAKTPDKKLRRREYSGRR